MSERNMAYPRDPTHPTEVREESSWSCHRLSPVKFPVESKHINMV